MGNWYFASSRRTSDRQVRSTISNPGTGIFHGETTLHDPAFAAVLCRQFAREHAAFEVRVGRWEVRILFSPFAGLVVRWPEDFCETPYECARRGPRRTRQKKFRTLRLLSPADIAHAPPRNQVGVPGLHFLAHSSKSLWSFVFLARSAKAHVARNRRQNGRGKGRSIRRVRALIRDLAIIYLRKKQ